MQQLAVLLRQVGDAPLKTRRSWFAPDTLLSSGYDVHSSHTPAYHVPDQVPVLPTVS